MNCKSALVSPRDFFAPHIVPYRGLRLLRSFVVLWMMVVMLIVGLPAHGYAQDDPSQLSPDAERAAQIINQLRANAGLPPLRVHPLLTLAVNRHISDMTTSGVYGHYGSDGASVHVRIARTGYETNGWNGENWAVYDTVDTSIGWWMGDPPHRENVLNSSYTEMGIGTAPHPQGWGLILVVDFSTGSVNGVEAVVAEQAQAVEIPQPEVPQPIVEPTASPSLISDSGVRHRVSPGDTLFAIGLAYGVDWQSVAQLNDLGTESILQIGSEVRIPGNAQSPPVESRAEAGVYIVAPGDTLLGIAIDLDLQWQTLAAANGLNENSLLQIGDTLTIPGAPETNIQSTSTQETVTVARSHTIQAGETVWEIAARYDVDWRVLLQYNGLGEQALLQIGQNLNLP